MEKQASRYTTFHLDFCALYHSIRCRRNEKYVYDKRKTSPKFLALEMCVIYKGTLLQTNPVYSACPITNPGFGRNSEIRGQGHIVYRSWGEYRLCLIVLSTWSPHQIRKHTSRACYLIPSALSWIINHRPHFICFPILQCFAFCAEIAFSLFFDTLVGSVFRIWSTKRELIWLTGLNTLAANVCKQRSTVKRNPTSKTRN